MNLEPLHDYAAYSYIREVLWKDITKSYCETENDQQECIPPVQLSSLVANEGNKAFSVQKLGLKPD